MAIEPENREGSARVLTAPGAGAVAVVEVALTDQALAAAAFSPFSPQPPRDVATLPVSRIVFGSWNGEDVVVVRISETLWEIQCHGGSIAVSRILSDLKSSGISVIADEHATRPGGDGVSAAIVKTLIRCRTRKTAGLALAQLDGRLERLLRDSHASSDSVRQTAIEKIEQWRNVGHHLAVPWRVALAGVPNVGKSSLMNTITGMQRSIVSSTPGTTRDLVEVDVVIGGWMFQFVDTAGVRPSSDSPIENLGIDQTLEALADCDLVCIVVDATQPALEPILVNRLAQATSNPFILWNKSDLLDQTQRSQTTDVMTEWANGPLNPAGQLLVSATTGTGLTELFQWIVQHLIPKEPTRETPLPVDGFDSVATAL